MVRGPTLRERVYELLKDDGGWFMANTVSSELSASPRMVRGVLLGFFRSGSMERKVAKPDVGCLAYAYRWLPNGAGLKVRRVAKRRPKPKPKTIGKVHQLGDRPKPVETVNLVREAIANQPLVDAVFNRWARD